MSEWLWGIFAWVVSRKTVADYLIKRSKRTPYYHLPGYMERHWLFNGYDPGQGRRERAEWLPSIRIHKILRADRGRDKHDHPWNARTIILRGGYVEARDTPSGEVMYLRTRGDTATLKFDEYHRIDAIDQDEETYTMFITWKYMGTWGFWVDGKKIPHREYKGEQP